MEKCYFIRKNKLEIVDFYLFLFFIPTFFLLRCDVEEKKYLFSNNDDIESMSLIYQMKCMEFLISSEKKH